MSSIPAPDVFEVRADRETWLDVHIALVERIASGDGFCFHNADPGHPTYVFGAAGQDDRHAADGPEQNATYQFLLATSKIIGRHPSERYRSIDSWSDFCQLARDGYRAALVKNG